MNVSEELLMFWKIEKDMEKYWGALIAYEALKLDEEIMKEIDEKKDETP